MAQGLTNIPQSSWQAPVATTAFLPTSGNHPGDTRVVLLDDSIWIWSGSTWVEATGGGGSGVTSLNSLTGAITLAAGANITLTPSGNTITIAATGSGFANTALSNLASTAVNVDIVPSNTSINLGSTVIPYGHLYTQNVVNPLIASNLGVMTSAQTGSNASGSLVLSSGNTVNGNAGNVVIEAGTASGSGTSGYISIGSAFNFNSNVVTNLVGTNITGTGSSFTAGNINATSNSTITTLSALSLPYSQVTGAPAAGITQLTGDVTAGPGSGSQVASLVATSNSTLTTLSALSLPVSQVTGLSWKTPVATAASLPSSGNTISDARITNDTSVLYIWNGSAWVAEDGLLGVTSLNTLTGSLAITAGTGISVTPSGTNIAITNTGVTSVAFSDASTTPIYSISGSPVTTTGTLTQTLTTQAANTVFAGPSTGSAAQPTFRALVNADVGTLTVANISATSNSTLTTLSSLSLPYSQLTGTPTLFTNPMTTLGDIIYENATPAPARLAGNITTTKEFLSQTGNGSISAAPAWAALVSGDIPNNAANTSGTAANVTGVVAVANGGTGSTALGGQSFLTSGTTYTTPSTITTSTIFKVTLIGGGGGGASANVAADHAPGGGGGGGVIVYITGLSPSTGYTYAIGAAGNGGASGSVGTNGTSTTFTALSTTYTAGGGGTPAAVTGAGGAGGTATGGTINIVGQAGGSGTTVTTANGGWGGNSPWGWGLGATSNAGSSASNGQVGTGYGAGGGGTSSNGAPVGGAGTGGCILIEWHN